MILQPSAADNDEFYAIGDPFHILQAVKRTAALGNATCFKQGGFILQALAGVTADVGVKRTADWARDARATMLS
jgi:hypothetical protein